MTTTDVNTWSPERAAFVLGAPDLDALLRQCPSEAVAEQLRRILANQATVEATMRQVALDSKHAGSSDAARLLTEARQRALIERAASTAASQAETARSRRIHEQRWTCQVVGEYDPTVSARRLYGRELKLSDRGEQAMHAVVAETLTAAELDAARTLLGLGPASKSRGRR